MSSGKTVFAFFKKAYEATSGFDINREFVPVTRTRIFVVFLIDILLCSSLRDFSGSFREESGLLRYNGIATRVTGYILFCGLEKT